VVSIGVETCQPPQRVVISSVPIAAGKYAVVWVRVVLFTLSLSSMAGGR